MLGVVVVLGCMLELEQGRSSCSDGDRLVVVVGLVAMGLQEVLGVLGVLQVLGFLGLLVVLVVH